MTEKEARAKVEGYKKYLSQHANPHIRNDATLAEMCDMLDMIVPADKKKLAAEKKAAEEAKKAAEEAKKAAEEAEAKKAKEKEKDKPK